MNVSFYIARRYLFARKRTNLINIISVISMVVVAGVAAAMIIILSAFNGIEALVEELFKTFQGDVIVTPAHGKTISTDSIDVADLLEIEGVMAASRVIEEDAWLQYFSPLGEASNVVATVKGIDPVYADITRLDSTLVWGNFFLGDTAHPNVIPGLGVLTELRIPLGQGQPPVIRVNAPQRGKKLSQYRDQAFSRNGANVSGVFSINADLDTRYLLASVDACQQWFGFSDEVSAFEIQASPETDPVALQERMVATLPLELVSVETRFQKNALIHQTNRSEKWATYLILLFILLIAAFNIVASLTMLIIEKKRDIFVLRSMGSSEAEIRRIFIVEGTLIYFLGAISGIAIGLFTCWLQMAFGLVSLPGATVDYYPMEVRGLDVLGVIATVMAVGTVCSAVLVPNLMRRFARV